MGRIDKTLFILDYISSETLPCLIQRGLNKGEAKKALSRASSLNPIINAISIWNTVYLSHAMEYLKSK